MADYASEVVNFRCSATVKLSDILGFHGLSICRQVPRLPWRRRPCLVLLILSRAAARIRSPT